MIMADIAKQLAKQLRHLVGGGMGIASLICTDCLIPQATLRNAETSHAALEAHPATAMG
jgi:hypothetical protein